MDKRKLDGTVDKSSTDSQIQRDWTYPVRPTPSETGSYSKQAGRQAHEIQVKFKICKGCCRQNIWFSDLFSQGTALFQQV